MECRCSSTQSCALFSQRLYCWCACEGSALTATHSAVQERKVHTDYLCCVTPFVLFSIYSYWMCTQAIIKRHNSSSGTVTVNEVLCALAAARLSVTFVSLQGINSELPIKRRAIVFFVHYFWSESSQENSEPSIHVAHVCAVLVVICSNRFGDKIVCGFADSTYQTSIFHCLLSNLIG